MVFLVCAGTSYPSQPQALKYHDLVNGVGETRRGLFRGGPPQDPHSSSGSSLDQDSGRDIFNDESAVVVKQKQVKNVLLSWERHDPQERYVIGGWWLSTPGDPMLNIPDPLRPQDFPSDNAGNEMQTSQIELFRSSDGGTIALDRLINFDEACFQVDGNNMVARVVPVVIVIPGLTSDSDSPTDLNAFIRTADPRKVRIVERAIAENERPIVTVAKHRTVTLLPTSVVRSSGELVYEAVIPRPSVSKKESKTYDSEGPACCSGSRLTVEQGVPALPTLPFITSSVTASPLEEGGDRTDSASKSADLEVDSLVRLLPPVFELRLLLLLLLLMFYNNVLLEQECNSLKLKVTGLESTIAEKDHELSDLGASSSSLKSQNQSLVNQVHELEISSTDLREKLEMYEESLKQLEEFQDNLMGPLRTRLAEIDADFTRCCMRFQESFHPHLLNVVAGRRWLLTHGMKLLLVKCLNSNEYMEALGHAFGRAIEKGMQEGLAAGIEHGQAGRCLTDLEAYIPSAEDDFNSAIRDLRDLNFPLLQELSNKKDASTWDIMDLLRLDDAVAETLGMTDLQPDVSQLMVPVHHKQDRVVIGSQALSVALDICRGRVEKMERNLIERLPFLKDVFVSIDDPLSAEALIEPPAEVPATNVLSTVVIVPHTDPSVSVEDYDNPDSADVVPENATLGSESEGKIDASARGGLTFSQLDDEARDAVL
ncbi:hypothetical protein Tco_0480321 [Tanacetum coccineum]